MQRQLRSAGIALAAALLLATTAAQAQVIVDPVRSFNENVAVTRSLLRTADVQAGRVEAVALRLRRGVIRPHRASLRMGAHMTELRRTIARLDQRARLLKAQVRPDRYSEARALDEFLASVQFIDGQADQLLDHVRAGRGYPAWHLADQMQHRLRDGYRQLDVLVRRIDRADLRPTVRYRY